MVYLQKIVNEAGTNNDTLEMETATQGNCIVSFKQFDCINLTQASGIAGCARRTSHATPNKQMGSHRKINQLLCANPSNKPASNAQGFEHHHGNKPTKFSELLDPRTPRCDL